MNIDDIAILILRNLYLSYTSICFIGVWHLFLKYVDFIEISCSMEESMIDEKWILYYTSENDIFYYYGELSNCNDIFLMSIKSKNTINKNLQHAIIRIGITFEYYEDNLNENKELLRKCIDDIVNNVNWFIDIFSEENMYENIIDIALEKIDSNCDPVIEAFITEDGIKYL